MTTPTLMVNVYGGLIPVSSVVEYGEHEVSIGGAPYERVQYARVRIAEPLSDVVVTADLRDLLIVSEDDECGICEAMAPLLCDTHRHVN